MSLLAVHVLVCPCGSTYCVLCHRLWKFKIILNRNFVRIPASTDGPVREVLRYYHYATAPSRPMPLDTSLYHTSITSWQDPSEQGLGTKEVEAFSPTLPTEGQVSASTSGRP